MFKANFFFDLIRFYPRCSCFTSGLLSGLIFAPFFKITLVFTLGILAYHTWAANSIRQAFSYGFYFGFAHFFIGLYWIAFAILIYLDDFWWALPFALFGLPLFMSLFVSFACAISNLCKNTAMFHLCFVVSWVLFEWIRSWVFTGLPWNLLGYSLSFSTTMIQSASIWGIWGLSVIVAYIGVGAMYFLLKRRLDLFFRQVLLSALILISLVIFGKHRLKTFPVSLSEVTVRLVQPNIPQKDKWNSEDFFNNLQQHIDLSMIPSDLQKPEIIIWPESAVPTFINDEYISKVLSNFLQPEQILISGAINQDFTETKSRQYVSMHGIDYTGRVIFDYNKIHLVPFGEYVPLKSILGIKKFTHGIADYTKGDKNQRIVVNKLKIKPLICYEAIFPDLARVSNSQVDMIINISNDSWYGDSPGPYQHFFMTRIRAVENGVPLLRAANSGISAIIDPLGRVIKASALGTQTYLESYIPNKIINATIYSLYPRYIMLFFLILVLFGVELINLRDSTSKVI
jgi:apolipoprotein N-acyltransferase